MVGRGEGGKNFKTTDILVSDMLRDLTLSQDVNLFSAALN